MFDLNSKMSFKNVKKWTRDFVRVCGKGAPKILIANKCDTKDAKVKNDEIKT